MVPALERVEHDWRYSKEFCPEGVDYTLFPINWLRHQVMIFLVASFRSVERPLRVLEVGSYLGQSALTWSKAIAENCAQGGSVMCVDPWLPFLCGEDVGQGFLYVQTQQSLRDGSAFAQFQKNIQKAPLQAPIHFFRGVLGEFPVDQFSSFDIVFIDGSHYYEDVQQDLAWAKDFVREGGVLCGDDLEKVFTTEIQAECRANKHRDFISGYHPGVTLAVWEEFGHVWCQDGLWAVRREGYKFVWPF